MLSAGSQAMGDGRLVVSGHMWSELPQIGEWWVQGRLVVAMGHTSERDVVVASVRASPSPMLGGAVHAAECMPWRFCGGCHWAYEVKTSPDRKVVGAGPIDSGHGS